MAAGLTNKQIYNKIRYRKKRYGQEVEKVLHASNGEVAIFFTERKTK